MNLFSDTAINTLIEALKDHANPATRDESRELLFDIKERRSHDVTQKQMALIEKALSE